jgi:hypothetical protein
MAPLPQTLPPLSALLPPLSVSWAWPPAERKPPSHGASKLSAVSGSLRKSQKQTGIKSIPYQQSKQADQVDSRTTTTDLHMRVHVHVCRDVGETEPDGDPTDNTRQTTNPQKSA